MNVILKINTKEFERLCLSSKLRRNEEKKKSRDIPVDYVITNTTNKMIVNINIFFIQNLVLAMAILSSATSEDLILCHFI